MTSQSDAIRAHIERITRLLSTTMLHELLETIRVGLSDEDALPAHSSPEVGFRNWEDFRWQADAIESELTMRGEVFVPIPW